MARAKQNKLYRSFVKGLVTEAGLLTYPEDSSSDELNTILYRKGNRSRRLGIDFEQGSTAIGVPVSNTMLTNEYSWMSVSNKSWVNLVCVQVGTHIHFYDMDTQPLSAGKKSFIIELTDYMAPGATADLVEDNYAQMVSGKGYLFIANKYTETLLVDYDSVTDTISVTPIKIIIRDFIGLDDGLPMDAEPTTLSDAHHYNLKNQGWVPTNQSSLDTSVVSTYYGPFGTITLPEGTASYASGPISKYFSLKGRYPGNNKQWWIARAEADDDAKGIKQGDFLPDLFDRFFSGNTRAPRGHYLIEAFYIDRSAVSGVSGIAIESKLERASSVAFYSGRAFYSSESTVYYSQVLDHKSKAGFCYQEADPTSEDISDLVATDGGVIPIPEATRIIRIVSIDSGVLVLATNGVWFIGGGSNGFDALEITVEKVSSIGCKAPMSVVSTDDSVFWWAETGIIAAKPQMGMFGPISGRFDQPNITEQTVQTLYMDIDESAKPFVKGLYDPRNNVITWLYRDEEITNKLYNRAINYDITLQAFYPWKFSKSTSSPIVKGLFLSGNIQRLGEEELVVEGAHTVQDLSIDVIVNRFETDIKPTGITYLVVNTSDFRFAKVTDPDFVDWQSWDSVGLTYDSYVETGYELFNDAMRNKQITYIMTYLRRTETSYDYNLSGEVTFNDPSSCYMRVKWDWSNSSVSNKWTTPVQIYRPTRALFMPEASGDYETGFPVVITKNKVRGSGRAIQFRFGTDERGKNFDILGWSIAVTGNTEV